MNSLSETNNVKKAYLKKLKETLLLNLNRDNKIKIPSDLKENIIDDTYTLCLAKLIKHESSDSIIYLISALY